MYCDNRQGQERNPQGRQGREAQDPQGPSSQARGLHPSVRQCYHDWWQAQGMLELYLDFGFDVGRNAMLTYSADEPEPDFVRECCWCGLMGDVIGTDYGI